MLRSNQQAIEERMADPLARDIDPPFDSKWVFSATRQQQLLTHVFDQVRPQSSLALFYTKSGHPLDERHRRLLIGVGTITALDTQQPYHQSRPGPQQPMWDRRIGHSIRPDGVNGLLLPYQDYLRPTGTPAEDARRAALAEDIAVGIDEAHTRAFSYGSELAGPDVALSLLSATLEAVRLIRTHGIAGGPWQAREDWLNARIAEQWKARGSYPGLGAALEGMGLRLGTALVRELLTNGTIRPDENPWPLIGALLEGRQPPPRTVYANDLANLGPLWSALPQPRRDLLHVLSRLDITTEAATRWLHPDRRAASTRATVSDVQILANPYRLAELDLGSGGSGERYIGPITAGTVDRGLLGPLPTSVPAPVQPPLTGAMDPRRIRAAVVDVLRHAAADGDTLLAEGEAAERVARLDLTTPLILPPYSLDALPGLADEVIRDTLPDPDGVAVPTLQLVERRAIAERLSKLLLARSAKAVASLGEDWQALLIAAIGPQVVDLADERHQAALAEQAKALETITTRRLSVLVGSAGTGKTSVLGGLLGSAKLLAEGILLLAPTGKARVRLSQAAAGEAMTVSQFLYRQGRYDGARQRPLIEGVTQKAKERGLYTGKRTVVIDECSMLTEDDLVAVLNALNLGFVQRLILVGDPNQLPPIGAGRPFADLVALLDRAGEAPAASPQAATAGALARLSVQLRAAGGSQALALAAWFTDDSQPVDADRILAKLDGQPALLPTELAAAEGPQPADDATARSNAEEHGQRLATVLPGGQRQFGDLEVVFWRTPEELRAALLAQMAKHLGADGVAGFNTALHIRGNLVPFTDHSGAERFQILSPVRMQPHGVHELNRLVQVTFRAAELDEGRRFRAALGAEEIVKRDKVICVTNSWIKGWDHVAGERPATTWPTARSGWWHRSRTSPAANNGASPSPDGKASTTTSPPRTCPETAEARWNWPTRSPSTRVRAASSTPSSSSCPKPAACCPGNSPTPR